MPKSETKMCPRCFIGVDNDGDGDCAICARVPDRFLTVEHFERAVQIARDAAFEEIIFMLGIANDAIGTRVVELHRRNYPKHGELERERAALAVARMRMFGRSIPSIQEAGEIGG